MSFVPTPKISLRFPRALPQELISEIIGACHPNLFTLHSWALVSTVHLPIARRHLYSEITFAGYWQSNDVEDGPGNSRSLDWTRASQFMKTIKGHSHLAILLKDLTLALGQGTWSAALWAQFLDVFPSMTQLECLRFDLCMFTPSLERMFRDTSIKLKELGVSMRPSTFNAEHFVQVLNKQGDLKILSLVGVAWHDSQVSADACLNLQSISTSSRRFIEDIVPGRPVVKLCWDLSDPDLHRLHPDMWNRSETSILARALSQIRILILQGLGDSGWLALITPYLNSLEVLDLSDYHEKNLKNLVELKKLETIIFRTGTAEYRQGTLIEPLFHLISTLELVFFRLPFLGEYSKWTRGAEDPVAAGLTEVALSLQVSKL